jgi:predicted nucleic acid-binding protein
MKRIFLDTNILIDYIDNRAGADDAEQIFACGFSGEALLFASSLTFSNMAYIIKGRTHANGTGRIAASHAVSRG